MKMSITFGSYIREKRKEKSLSLRALAGKTGLSPVYLSNIENDRCPAPSRKYQDRTVEVLDLTRSEAETLYDLAADSQINGVSQDLPDYIMRHDVVRVALRTAKDVDATDEEWQTFNETLRQRDQQREGSTDEQRYSLLSSASD